MLSIFLDLFKDCMEVFMDDFTVYWCIETDLVLNFENFHFMVTKGIVLGHLVSSQGIEVDKAKIDIITSLLIPPLCGIKIALPLSKLLQKDVEFVFNKECIQAFEELKTRLTSTPILQAPNWELPFELMCDVSNSTLGIILDQRDGVGQPVHVIAYASWTMDLT
ncbi:Retrovirus-related Pol polyprotein from transposon opus, partial [Mucuna pruriens]